MENKKEEKSKLSFKLHNNVSIILSITIFIYFLYGFYVNENSAGAGGYYGDFKIIWSNLILLKKDLIFNITSADYNDSRPPLSYILHIFLNPLSATKEGFRLSNFIISLSIPILLFFSIRINYEHLDKNLAILLSLIVTLSPYFRTTSYWALGENYGLIFLLLSYLTYVEIEKNIKTFSSLKVNLMILLLCFFSSIIVYFDQKLVFVPFLILYLIFKLNIKINYKLKTIFIFFIFSLPYFYLMYLWQGFIPTSANIGREVGSKIHLFHPGYCLTIMMVSIFPFIFLTKINLKKHLTNKKIIFSLSIFLLYTILLLFFDSFGDIRVEGKGAFHKFSLLLISNTNLRLVITLLIFLISLILTLIIFSKIRDLFIISYFVMLSLFVFPFYQEYLDPVMFILIFSFFKFRFNINNRKNVYFLVFYYFIFSLSSNYYYNFLI